MNRRELIRAAIPAALVPTVVINGEAKAAAVEVTKKYFMLFVDSKAVDISVLHSTPLPEVAKDIVMDIFPVYLSEGQSIQDAVALYAVEKPESNCGSGIITLGSQ